MDKSVHPTAIVHPTARIGKTTDVGGYAVIEADTVIGEDNRIGFHAVIKRHTLMGNGNQIFEGAVLGGIPQDLKFTGAQSFLKIGHRNVFREGVTVHRSAEAGKETMIGNDNYLMAHAHVAHNCVLEDHIVIANNGLLAGHIHVESNSFVSGGVVIHQFCRIGRHSMIGGNSKVAQDALPFFLIDGVPARTRAINHVGLQRAGFSEAEISDLKQAYRILSKTEVQLGERMAALRTMDSENVQHLVSFIEQSERGFCRIK
jgi:UDP-N-acetylglucosamine acyltransferase